MKPETSHSISSTLPRLTMINKDSHTISKITPPKIRIIHIFAPKIIKTDEANFRQLVQELTGKRAHRESINKNTLLSEPEGGGSEPRKNLMDLELDGGGHHMRMKMEDDEEESATSLFISTSQTNTNNKGGHENTTHGFLGGFSDMDRFFHDPSEFPSLPSNSKYSQFNLFGGMPFC